MKPIKRRKFISLLRRHFFVTFVREAKGSHALYSSPNGSAIIPHYEELSGLLVKKILTQLDIDHNDFVKLLKK